MSKCRKKNYKLKEKLKKLKKSITNFNSSKNSHDEIINVVADITIENYRFMRTFSNCLNKLEQLESGASKKYRGRYQFFNTKLAENLERIGIHIEDFTGKKFDEGLPITALNLDEFQNSNEKLYIEQMLEPVLIFNGNILRNGTVMLRGIEK